MKEKVCFIKDPQSDSVLYVGKKLEDQLFYLEKVTNCLVFVEKGMRVAPSLLAKHEFRFVDDPVLDYAIYTRKIAEGLFDKDKKRHYILKDGSYIGENVTIGTDVYIEPGALIGHDVVIGDGTVVLAGAVIKNAVIGKNCLVKEHAVVGAQAFMMAHDEQGNNLRIPCLGGVEMKDHSEVGSFSNLCVGSNTVTTLGEYSKVDDHVHVGHDCLIGGNVLITAGVVLGGYTSIGDKAYIGLNATTKQMVSIAAGATVSMGARVAKDVKPSEAPFGMPQPKV